MEVHFTSSKTSRILLFSSSNKRWLMDKISLDQYEKGPVLNNEVTNQGQVKQPNTLAKQT